MLLWLLLLLSRAQQYLKGVDSSFDSVQPLQLLPSQTSNYRTTTITMTNLTQKRDNSTTTGSEEVGSVGWWRSITIFVPKCCNVRSWCQLLRWQLLISRKKRRFFVWLLLWGATCRINSIDGSRWKRNCCTVLRGSKKDDDLMCHRSSVRVSMLVREGGKLWGVSVVGCGLGSGNRLGMDGWVGGDVATLRWELCMAFWWVTRSV